MDATPHPSRSAPLCSACRHVHLSTRTNQLMCNHASTPVDPATGVPVIRADDMRTGARFIARLAPNAPFCGEAAALFEPLTGALPGQLSVV